MTQSIDWWAIAAPLCLVAAAVLALLLDAFVPKGSGTLPCAVTLGGVTAALAVTAALRDSERAAFCLPARLEEPVDCSWVVDRVALVWWVIALVACGLVALLLAPAVSAGEMPGGEAYFLLLCSTAGALSVAASHDLVTLVVAMETVSLPSFALVGLRRRPRSGAEAALKFFVTSVVATAITLLGISMVYGATGSVAAGAVATSVATSSAVRPLIGVGMVLTLVGLGFKVAAVPFQAWVPDTYVGAPVPVAAYLSVVSKTAGLAGVTIVVVRFFPPYADVWSPMLGVAAAATMTVGNLAALLQRHAVRVLAWSSVAHVGFLLVPLAAGGNAAAVGALQTYAAMYALVNLGAFSVIAAVSARGATLVSDYRGLVRQEPLLGLALAFALLCLAGLPPGIVGLLAKVVIFRSAVDGGVTWLAVVMAANVALGLVYYLRFVATLVAPSPESAVGSSWDHHSHLSVPASVGFVISATLIGSVALSVWPAPLFAVLP